MISRTLAVAAIAWSPALADEVTFPAALAGHAVMPALTLIPPPSDAPADSRISGKFTGPSRNDVPGSVPGDTGAMHGKRLTGISSPFEGQPLQGLSGFAMEAAADGAVWTLSDNGFGSKANSPDALLMLHRLVPDFAAGTISATETIFLRDPDRKVPFRIAYEGTDSRYLTGADFDPESIQVVGDRIFIGEEFGPYLVEVASDGRVVAVIPTQLDGAELKSVDAPGISATSVAGKDYRVTRSSGYEGLALQPGTGLLWGMLEKPILGEDGQPEGQFLRMLAFDPARGAWTGESVKFRLAEGATAIGDFNFIDGTRALVIERDNGEGVPALKCAGDPTPDCFPLPAVLKRVVLIDTGAVDADGFVKRIGHIDLMAIADPQSKGRVPTAGGVAGTYSFPFFTIESVRRVDETHIAVGNDNNLPGSSGRALDKAADNEVLLLSVPELLAAN
jgi:hypothetical protein